MKFSSEKTKLLIAKQQISLDRLSKAANMPLVTLSQALSGRRSPTLRTIGRIAQGLGVDVTDIIEEA